MAGLSHRQKKILEVLKLQPGMTTREMAESIFGRLIEYRSKEYSSIHRSISSLERRGLVRRTQTQLRWFVAQEADGKQSVKQAYDEWEFTA
jgi:DNA-binding MarR family transcriptional regulator